MQVVVADRKRFLENLEIDKSDMRTDKPLEEGREVVNASTCLMFEDDISLQCNKHLDAPSC